MASLTVFFVEFAPVVAPAVGAVVPDLLQGVEGDGAVDMPVAGTGQPMPSVLPAGDLDRCDTDVAGEVRLAAEPTDRSGMASTRTARMDPTPPISVRLVLALRVRRALRMNAKTKQPPLASGCPTRSRVRKPDSRSSGWSRPPSEPARTAPSVVSHYSFFTC
jgi:hypothetical protein